MEIKSANTTSSRQAIKRVAGFSMMELMVSLTAGAFVAGSAFVVGAASSQFFADQGRLAQTQIAIRLGTEQLRRDISKAGFMSVPNTRRLGVCLLPSRHLQAIEFINNESNTVPNATENGVSTDRLRLVGNYMTSDMYLSAGTDTSGTTVTLQTTWQGFRRSFVDRTTNAIDATAFTAVFRAGRMLHIRTQQGMDFFVTIVSSNPLTSTVTFTPALPVGSACMAGFAEGAQVAPLARIEYYVGSIGGDVNPQNTAVTGTPTQLLRREIAFDANATPIAGTERVAVEFAVDFNLEFILDQALGLTTRPNLVRINGVTAATALKNVNDNPSAVPQQVRSVIISISARTPEQDINYKFVRRPTGAPLTRYRVNPTLPGAARVRTIVSEALLPNIAAMGRL